VPGEPPDHALGRSRGGLSTKVHALSDLTCTPVIALLTAGQAGDNPMLATLVRALGASGHDQDLRLLADKAYSHPSTRTFLRDQKIKHTIPERSDQIAHRKAKGSKGGRPPGFDAETYKQRNTIERSFNRVKQWRGLATRYDKYAVTYLGGFLLGMVILTHRANHWQTRPSPRLRITPAR
jgi:putative transposase